MPSSEEAARVGRVSEPEPRPGPRYELVECERLGEIVRRTQVEAPHLGLDVRERRDDHDLLIGAYGHEPAE